MFSGFAPEGVSWLRELQENNSRDWYQTHKETYRIGLDEPGRQLLNFVEGKLAGYAGKLFRLHRDLRFSQDKRPYHCHLRIAWSSTNRASLFFSLEPDKLILGSGGLVFDASQLAGFRRRVIAEPDSLSTLLAPYRNSGYHLSPPELKRAPAGLSGEGAASQWLRHKSLCLWREVPIPPVLYTAQAGDWCWEQWRAMAPFRGWLDLAWEAPDAL
ncbi:DUF2461 domain-containing protein [bacterium]|nr:DUF2461 domain-containing protein [bacterium]